jgi:hypothetical protein
MTGEQPVEDPAIAFKKLEAELAATKAELTHEKRLRCLEVENEKLRAALQAKTSDTPILDKVLGAADRYLDLVIEAEAREAEKEKAAKPAPEPEQPPAPQ